MLKENEGAGKNITMKCLISANEFGMFSHQFRVKVLLLKLILKRLATHYFRIFCLFAQLLNQVTGSDPTIYKVKTFYKET